MNSFKSIEKQLLDRVYGKGRGWSFSKKDFGQLGDPASIDRALSRLAEKGVIRRVMRGLYDYPAYSTLLKKELSSDIDQVAHALARKFGWQIQISGNAALNILGLSTQVPTQYRYLSDGPSKTYKVGNIDVYFKKTRFTQLGLKHSQSEILVQAIQAFGDKPLNNEQQQKVRTYLLRTYFMRASGGLANKNMHANVLPEALIKRTLKDTQYVTSWIARNIRHVLLGNNSTARDTNTSGRDAS